MGLLQRLVGLIGGRPRPPHVPEVAAVVAAPKPPPPARGEPAGVVRQVCGEAIGATADWRASLGESRRWQALKNQAPELQVAVLFAALDGSRDAVFLNDRWQAERVRREMVGALLRRSLPLAAEDLMRLLGLWLAHPHTLERGLPPGATLLGAVERYAAQAPLTPAMRATLRRARKRAASVSDKFHQRAAQRIDRLLDPESASDFTLPPGGFAKHLTNWLEPLPEGERLAWRDILMLAAAAGDKPAPARKWLDAASAAMQPLGPAKMAAQLLEWLEACTPDPKRPDASLDILKGLLFMSTFLDHAEVAGPVGRFADRCFTKVPGVGARSVKLGNAALWALSRMVGEPRAAAELFRLRDRVKFPSARKIIADRLAELADSGGRSVQDMEDGSLPDFGLDADGQATINLGGVRAELVLHADRLEVRWFNGERSVKAAPAEVRTRAAAALAECRRRIRDIELARAAQALRLEQSWIEGRDWSLADWTANWLGHPLRRPLAEALIWRIGNLAVMSAGDELADVAGAPRAFGADARVQLWHPLDSDPQEVLAWRRRIVELGLTQPIKQAHREIYVLTDAERTTNVYSNRFAAHILRQHQFRALCQARGWTYDLMGGWDSFSVPTRVLPGQGLQVEYSVEAIVDGDLTRAGASLYLASDQVRFVGGQNRAVELAAVSPIVFSEVLRDVDLFVAVTSVANDPHWTDGGPDGRHGAYWRQWTFGELGQSAATRRELIASIAPKLSIADKLEVTDKFLVVTGRRQDYAIHFGSGNIQIRPGNRYLCIVPDRDPSEIAALRLPFAGDSVLSTILAKAFLLVDERRITDPTILRQLM